MLIKLFIIISFSGIFLHKISIQHDSSGVSVSVASGLVSAVAQQESLVCKDAFSINDLTDRACCRHEPGVLGKLGKLVVGTMWHGFLVVKRKQQHSSTCKTAASYCWSGTGPGAQLSVLS